MDQIPPEQQSEPQEPSIIPESQTRKYISKYFVRISYSIVFIGIAIAAGVYGGIWLWNQRNADTPLVDEVSSWQTYQNEDFGFELKYPSLATVENKTSTTEVGTILPTFLIKTENWEFEIFGIPETHGRGEAAFTTEQKFQTNIGGRDFKIFIYRPLSVNQMNDNRQQLEEHYRWLGTSEGDIDKAIKEDWDFFKKNTVLRSNFEFLFEKSPYALTQFSMVCPIGKMNESECLNLFNQILSTFKLAISDKPEFTEQMIKSIVNKDPVTGWNIYKNETYQFEISYPPDWNIYESKELPPIDTVGAINIYKGTDSGNPGFMPPENETFVGIYPRGSDAPVFLGGSLSSEGREGKNINEVRGENVRENILDNGQVWRIGIGFNKAPSSWLNHGLISASVKVENPIEVCIKNGKEIGWSECNHPSFEPNYDYIRLNGKINSEDMKTIRQILSTFKFLEK